MLPRSFCVRICFVYSLACDHINIALLAGELLKLNYYYLLLSIYNNNDNISEINFGLTWKSVCLITGPGQLDRFI